MVKRSWLVWIGLVVVCNIASAEMPEIGPLAKYVAKPDAAYKWN